MTVVRKGFGDRLREARRSEEYQVAVATIEFTEGVFGRMEELGLSKSDLAGRLGTSPAYVAKLLRGNTNVTLKTMVRLGRALDTELEVGFPPSDPLPARRAWSVMSGPNPRCCKTRSNRTTGK